MYPAYYFYPEQEQPLSSTYEVYDLDPLTLVEVPVNAVDEQLLGETIQHSISDQLGW
jgi:hypothetical protein